MFPGLKEVIDGLRPYVRMELCWSCYPEEGGAFAKIQKPETMEDRLRMEEVAKQVKEALDRKMASSDPETFDAESVARGLIKRIDEDMAYDAMDRRIRFMVREARPVKFSLMKKNINGDDLLTAIEDLRQKIGQLTWRYRGARNASERFEKLSDKETWEASRVRNHVSALEGLLKLEGDPAKKLSIEVSLASAKKKAIGAEKRSDNFEVARARSRESARKDIKYLRAYRSLLHEVCHIYGIRWSVLISEWPSKGSTKFYPIREEAFGKEEFDTPMIEQERCGDCGKKVKTLNAFPIRAEFEDDKGGKKLKVVDTVFLCKKCKLLRKIGGSEKSASKEPTTSKPARVYQDSEVMTRNLDKEMSQEVRLVADQATRFALESISGKFQKAVRVENVDYKSYESDLWVVAVPSPGAKLPKELVFEGKALVKFLSVPAGNFGSAYLWAKLGNAGREKWQKEAVRRSWSLSPIGLRRDFEIVMSPKEIAAWLEVKLPEFGSDYWRSEYELGNYSDMTWEGRVSAVRESDPEYDEVLLYKYSVAWMQEIESDQKAFDAIDEAWYKHGVQLGNAPKEIKPEEHSVDKMFSCSIYPGPMIVKDQEVLDEGRRREALWQKLQRVKGEFNQLADAIYSFNYYLKAWSKGRDFDTVYAEWKKEWDAYQSKMKSNKGNAQPK